RHQQGIDLERSDARREPRPAPRLVVQTQQQQQRKPGTADFHHATDHPVSRAMKTVNRLSFAAVVLGLVALLPACSSKLTGTSSSYLLIDSLKAASVQSSSARTFFNELESDVCVGNTAGGCTVFEDVGEVTLSMALKDPGAQLVANVPSDLNFIT